MVEHVESLLGLSDTVLTRNRTTFEYLLDMFTGIGPSSFRMVTMGNPLFDAATRTSPLVGAMSGFGMPIAPDAGQWMHQRSAEQRAAMVDQREYRNYAQARYIHDARAKEMEELDRKQIKARVDLAQARREGDTEGERKAGIEIEKLAFEQKKLSAEYEATRSHAFSSCLFAW